MTAPAFTSSLESASVEPLFGYRPRLPIASRTPRSNVKTLAAKRRDPIVPPSFDCDLVDWNVLSRVLELLPQGVLVLSSDLRLLYHNYKAKQLCQLLSQERLTDRSLPRPLTDLCRKVVNDQRAIAATLATEWEIATGQVVRLSARLMWPSTEPDPDARSPLVEAPCNQASPCVVVFIENYHDRIQQEAKIQQQKYDLTERETEIWSLLQQELTYQEIAQKLQISLNTVKTHVKNVYAKRRSCHGAEKFWC